MTTQISATTQDIVEFYTQEAVTGEIFPQNSFAWLGVVDNYTPNQTGYAHGIEVNKAARLFYDGLIVSVNNDGGSQRAPLNYDLMIDAIYSFIDSGVKVSNLSFGGGFKKFIGDGTKYKPEYNGTKYLLPGETARPTEFAKNEVLYRVYRDFFEKGLTFVQAAGNELFADHRNTPEFDTSFLNTTGFALTVSAAFVDPVTGQITPEPYSQLHPAFIDYFQVGDATGGARGTSFAAPRVAGAIASLQQKHNGDLTQSEIRTILNMNADYFGYQKNSGLNVGEVQYRFLDTDSLENYDFVRGEITNQMKVIAMYEVYLDRNPDQGGLEFWTQYSIDNSLEQTALAFKNSDEYRFKNQFVVDRITPIEQVQSMYHLFLGRESDDAGLSYWLDRFINEYPDPNAGRSLFDPRNVQYVNTDLTKIADAFIAGAIANGESISSDLFFV